MTAKNSIEYTRLDSYSEIPDVLIQSPATNSAYLVPADELARFEVAATDWQKMSLNTVTFTLPEAGLIEKVPPFKQANDEFPDVLIQWHSARKSFLILADQLAKYEVPVGRERGEGYDVSFIIPRGTELIELLPSLQGSMLQSGESHGG